MKSLILTVILIFSDNFAQAKSFEIMNPQVYQGGVAIIRIYPQFQTQAQGAPVCIAVKWDGINSPGKEYSPNKQGYVLIGIESDRNPNKYILLRIMCGRGDRLDWTYEEFEVLKTSFLKTRISRFTGKPKSRTDKQKRDIDKALNSADHSDDLTDNLTYRDPLDLARDVIDPFGSIYENNPDRFHTGVDLRAPVGTPVKAINGGKISFVGKRSRSPEGNMVIINHGLGLSSVYMHLSKFGKLRDARIVKGARRLIARDLRVGDVVEKGQVIGSSGRSGIGVEEPHLHFNIRIKDTYVDPLNFIDTIDQHVK